jgi:ectoine hydroxylase-related dioxygenase (phytanoyl-CoA dioxygenase family)
MKITVCKTEMDFPGEVGELRDSNDLLGDRDALHKRIEEEGYLLLRDFIDREDVLAAKELFCREIESAKAGSIQLNSEHVVREEEFVKVFESAILFEFFEKFFGEPALTFDFKWLRQVMPGKFSGLHFDNVYMGRGSDRLHTVWVPIGDLTPELGTLVLNVGSHKERKKKLIDTYGMMDVDRDKVAGWFSDDPREYTEKYGGQWQTTSFKAGDIVVFTMFTMHCSTLNLTDGDRYSCDIRFQPASNPVDERWYGKDAPGHTAAEDQKSMEEFREEYGI